MNGINGQLKSGFIKVGNLHDKVCGAKMAIKAFYIMQILSK